MISQLGSYKASRVPQRCQSNVSKTRRQTNFVLLPVWDIRRSGKKKMRFERAPKQEGRQIRRPFAAFLLVLLTINAAGWFAPLFGAIYVAAAELRRTSRHQPYFSLLRWFDAVLSQKQALCFYTTLLLVFSL